MNYVEIAPAFDMTQFYLHFYTKGLVAFDGTEILKDIRLRSLVELDSLFPDGDLSNHHSYLKYIRNIDDDRVLSELMNRIRGLGMPVDGDSLKFHFVEYRTNSDVLKWHNDNGSHFADHNVTINCFFDDTEEATGGRFDVSQWESTVWGATSDHPLMWSIYPKKFTIVVFNQNPDFLHKVQHTNKLRRMISIAGRTY